MKRDTAYLRHILDAIARIHEYTEGMDLDQFHSNNLVQDAVIRQLEVVGEAVKNLSPDLRKTHPKVTWQDIAGMRDKLIHHYFGVDLDTVWLTLNDDLPFLQSQVTDILKNLT